MTGDKINLIPIELQTRRKLYLNLGKYKEASQKYLHKNRLR